MNNCPHLRNRLLSLLGVLTLCSGLVMTGFGSTATADEYATATELGLMEGFPPPSDKRVTKANALLTPPFNRWSYLNMRMIYPSAPIAAADKAVAVDRALDKGIDEVTVRNPDSGAMADMATYMKETYTDALVVTMVGYALFVAEDFGVFPAGLDNLRAYYERLSEREAFKLATTS